MPGLTDIQLSVLVPQGLAGATLHCKRCLLPAHRQLLPFAADHAASHSHLHKYQISILADKLVQACSNKLAVAPWHTAVLGSYCCMGKGGTDVLLKPGEPVTAASLHTNAI